MNIKEEAILALTDLRSLENLLLLSELLGDLTE
jgi:hypothetical protein